MRTYSDLRTGRFAVIADFEDERQLQIVEFQSSDASVQPLRLMAEPRASGRQCLAMEFRDPQDRLVLGNRQAVDWYFKRDWRAYELLLLSVHGPPEDKKRPGLQWRADLEIVSGEGESCRRIESVVTLHSGWNELRFDLVELIDRIGLDDVRELHVRLPDAVQPTALRLDDVILAGNRQDVLGDSSKHDGRLYAQRVGLGWNIGAGGRFEIGFTHGQVVRWFDLTSDPLRLNNLLHGTVLGPSWIGSERASPPRNVSPAEEPSLTAHHSSIRSVTRVVEMNQVRVAVAVEWFADSDHQSPESSSPIRSWIYTIYPTGQIFVHLQGPFGTSVAGRPIEWEMTVPSQVSISTAGSPSDYALLQPLVGDSTLLMIPAQGGCTLHKGSGSDDRRIELRGPVQPQTDSIASLAMQFVLRSGGHLSEREAAEYFQAFAHPARVRSLDAPAPDDPRGTSPPPRFDPSQGCYVLDSFTGRGRFVLEGRSAPMMNPAFCVAADDFTQDAWIYVNHKLHPFYRDPEGHQMVFQIIGPIHQDVLVEIIQKRP